MLLASGGALLSALTATNNGPVSGIGLGTVDTSSATITPSGGTPSYTYSAAYLSGDTVTIVGGTTAAPSFRRTGVVLFDFFEGVVQVTVTDAASRTTTTEVNWSITGG